MAFIYDLTDTWNAGGTTFNAIKMNVTDTASAAASKLITVQVSGSERFGVDKAGNVLIGNGGDLLLSSATGGNNTTLYNDAQDLYIATNGSTRMYINSSGSVGIGTTSPATKLDVVTASAVAASFSRDGTDGDVVQIYNGTTGTTKALYLGVASTSGIIGSQFGGLIFQPGSSEAMRITDAGSVGIGTSSPDAKLHVSGTAATPAVLGRTNSDTNCNIEYRGSATSVYAGKGAGDIWAVGSGSDLSNATTTKFVVDTGNGNVGIGTTSPSAKLHVADAVNGKILISGSSTSAELELSAPIPKITFTDTSGTAVDGEIKVDGSAMQFGMGGTERVRIDSSGKLLVGTTTATAASVNGLVQAQSEIVSKGSLAGFFWEDRAGGVTSSANWYGWYTSSGTVYLYNGSANIASINGSTGAYTALSDADKKRDFEASSIGLNEIMALKPTLYRMKGQTEDTPKQLGFLAQEVKEYIPQAYVETDDFIGLNDRAIVAALVKAVQELTARVAQLEGQ